jgi:hypothetical protein
MGKFDWSELIIAPFLLAIGILVAQTLIGSTDESVREAGAYMRYLTVAAGAIWLGSLGWRLRRRNS